MEKKKVSTEDCLVSYFYSIHTSHKQQATVTNLNLFLISLEWFLLQ